MQYAPLHDAVESLTYWRRRRARLPWYRRGARREAARMAGRWERRVRTAAMRQNEVPLDQRLDAAKLLARICAARWGRRAAAAFLAMSAMFALAAGATFALLLRAF
jgi:hypothetical protein